MSDNGDKIIRIEARGKLPPRESEALRSRLLQVIEWDKELYANAQDDEDRLANAQRAMFGAMLLVKSIVGKDILKTLYEGDRSDDALETLMQRILPVQQLFQTLDDEDDEGSLHALLLEMVSVKSGGKPILFADRCPKQGKAKSKADFYRLKILGWISLLKAVEPPLPFPDRIIEDAFAKPNIRTIKETWPDIVKARFGIAYVKRYLETAALGRQPPFIWTNEEEVRAAIEADAQRFHHHNQQKS